MALVKLFYGSTSGNTQQVATLISAAFGDSLEGIYDIAKASGPDLESADCLILGVSTWDMGAMQKDWAAFAPQLESLSLAGKKVALYGLGDAQAYSGLFVNGLRTLHDLVVGRGAEIVGRWPVDGYDFHSTHAVMNGSFVGLVIDQENQSTLTHERVVTWVHQLLTEFGVRNDHGDELYGQYNPPPRPKR